MPNKVKCPRHDPGRYPRSAQRYAQGLSGDTYCGHNFYTGMKLPSLQISMKSKRTSKWIKHINTLDINSYACAALGNNFSYLIRTIMNSPGPGIRSTTRVRVDPPSPGDQSRLTHNHMLAWPDDIGTAMPTNSEADDLINYYHTLSSYHNLPIPSMIL